MLARDDIERLAERFYAFDHEWRFYWSFLGEPFLINDVLVYFDGLVLYISAFPLDDRDRILSAREVEDVARSRPEFRDCRCIDVWGRFDPPDTLTLGSTPYEKVEESGYGENPVASVIDVDLFALTEHRKARKAINRARNKGYSSRIMSPAGLSARQISLVEEWRESHELGPIGLGIAAALPGYMHWDNMRVVEAAVGDEAVGFGLVSLASQHAAVLLQSFLRKSPGGVAGDVVFAGAISLCKEEGVRDLHVGYSATESLAAFKIKWGARPCDPYREAFYSFDIRMRRLVSRGMFLWQRRVITDVSSEDQ